MATQGQVGTEPWTQTAQPVPAALHSRLVTAIAAQLGSAREAAWIVEHAVADLATGASGVHPSCTDGSPGHDPRRGHEDRSGPLEGRRLEQTVRGLADRRAAGEPLQYVLGRWAFRSLELTVDPRVLIPRPETEQVVQVALGELERICTGSDPHHAADDQTGPLTRNRVCVDLGTGSGAIALSLATEGGALCPALDVWATDSSADALRVALENLIALGESDGAAAGRVHLREGPWFDALPPELAGHVDLVVSNPPYVAESEYRHLDPTVRDWEPRGALVAGPGAGGAEGMAAIEAIIAGAPRWLHRAGAVVIEIAPAQAQASADAAHRAGFGQVTTERDLAGRLRMLVARC